MDAYEVVRVGLFENNAVALLIYETHLFQDRFDEQEGGSPLFRFVANQASAEDELEGSSSTSATSSSQRQQNATTYGATQERDTAG